jgi:NAD(P)-dependent dehydrogenase (short-subunit alcohol dehydrogenase family)
MTRRILVTGAASGIGAGIVRHWAGLGDRVVATDIDDATGRVLAADTGATYEHLDVTDESAWRAFAE